MWSVSDEHQKLECNPHFLLGFLTDFHIESNQCERKRKSITGSHFVPAWFRGTAQGAAEHMWVFVRSSEHPCERIRPFTPTWSDPFLLTIYPLVCSRDASSSEF